MSSKLFTPFKLRDIEFRNRIFISPMCQYSAVDGVPSAWHLVHLGSRAVGGAACVIQEATSVSPEGRISPEDFGMWNDQQMAACQPITSFIKDNGAVPAIQLAHAGRKASTFAPWRGAGLVDESKGGWKNILAPSAIAFDPTYGTPREMTTQDITALLGSFKDATHRSLKAGYQVVEIHAAHGYLMHEFLSPLTNKRNDSYGGSFENRIRLVREVAVAVRGIWPKNLPVFVRISASDWVTGGWDIEQSVKLSTALREDGIDLIDTSSGGAVADAVIPAGPGYQIPFAARIRAEAKIPTGAVGFITDPAQAEQIIAMGEADIVLLARESLRDPYWPLHAAKALGADIAWPKQYERAKPR